MDDLIKSLRILQQYIPFRPCGQDATKCFNQQWPTHCEHDILMVPSINEVVWEELPQAHKDELEALGWCFLEEYDCIGSYRFGSS